MSEPRSCRACAGPITRSSRTGLCGDCARRDPELQAKRVAASRKAYAERPELIQQASDRLRALTKTPEHAERARRTMKESKLWLVGSQHLGPKGSPIRQKAGRSLSRARLAWCPAHLRAMYHELIYSKRLSAAEARALVLEHEAKELQRLRIRMGAEIPDPSEVYENAPPLPLPISGRSRPVSAAPPPPELAESIAEAFGYPLADIAGPGRARAIVHARGACAWVLRQLGYKLLPIGAVLGRSDHKSILYLIRMFEERATPRDRRIAARLAQPTELQEAA